MWFLVPKVNIPGLLALSLAYLALFLLLLRFASLLRHEDVAELRALDFKKLNRLLDLLAGPAK